MSIFLNISAMYHHLCIINNLIILALDSYEMIVDDSERSPNQLSYLVKNREQVINLIVTAESEVKHKVLHRNFEKRELENIF